MAPNTSPSAFRRFLLRRSGGTGDDGGVERLPARGQQELMRNLINRVTRRLKTDGRHRHVPTTSSPSTGGQSWRECSVAVSPASLKNPAIPLLRLRKRRHACVFFCR